MRIERPSANSPCSNIGQLQALGLVAWEADVGNGQNVRCTPPRRVSLGHVVFDVVPFGATPTASS